MIIAKRVIRLVLSPLLAVGICVVFWFSYVYDVLSRNDEDHRRVRDQGRNARGSGATVFRDGFRRAGEILQPRCEYCQHMEQGHVLTRKPTGKVVRRPEYVQWRQGKK